MIELKKVFIANSIFLFIVLISIFSCDKPNEEDNLNPTPATPDLTRLPFGGNAPTNILIRNQGNPRPDFLSLWLCGLPADGAGADNASAWTNADGTWDYTKKPQVEGNVTWDHELSIALDGSGNRIITGNALPDHPTGVFPIEPGTIPYQYAV